MRGIAMKLDSIKTVYDFMSYCKMNKFFQRDIRDMKVGDTYFLGQYKEPISDDDDSGDFVAEAWIEKERGVYRFYGTWTFITKPLRPLIMTFGEFKIIKGGLIEFSKGMTGVKQFALVCRYLDLMLRRMSVNERQRYTSAGSRPLFRGVWLDKDFIARRRHFDLEKQSWYSISYKDYAPTQQLAAIVMAGIACNAIDMPEII